ncbi:hypothetical protein AVEN_242305-1 [Araneus ventricosus]|uniref:Uncharacterized protein n=1 Tax=Araneus ventricosus TaxID=182803 RepID=A0A4Y2NIM9_ARAVE|nr:hypothetical protein AVEN_242305-1 [Araneus ventricosus]
MTSVTKKKFVRTEVLNTYDLPTNEQKIVKVLRSCGNNLHEVVTPEGDKFLANQGKVVFDRLSILISGVPGFKESKLLIVPAVLDGTAE